MEFIIFDEPVTHHTLKRMTNDRDNNSVGGHKQKKKKKNSIFYRYWYDVDRIFGPQPDCIVRHLSRHR